MFEKLKAMFRRKKPEQPKPERPSASTAYGLRTEPTHARHSAPTETARRNDSNDLLNPLNPMSLTNPLWHSSAPTPSDCGSRYDSSSYCDRPISDTGSSSSSSDSSSCSSCD